MSITIKKGKLVKVDGEWAIEYMAESAGPNNWYNTIPIYGLHENNHVLNDLSLSIKLNKPVCDLVESEVEWSYNSDEYIAIIL